MPAFEYSFVIRRPRADVFAVLTDLEEDVKWRREWVDGRKTSAGPIDVDSTFVLVGALLGRRIETTYTTTEYEPGRAAAWRAASGPLPLTFRRTFEDVEGGTRVTITYDADVSGFKRLLLMALAPLGRRQLLGDIPALKKLLEGSPA